MPAPRTPHEAVLHAARDVAKLASAFDAELLGSALLGSVYAVAEEDRAAAVRGFVGDFLVETARRRTAAAGTIRAVFAALVTDAPGAAEVRAPAQAPSWAAQLGRVRPTAAYSYGDVFGDQTSYVASFAYDDDELGGPEHAIVVLVDHNIGIAKDVFVGGPADAVIGQIRELCAQDELTWFTEVAPERMRAEVYRHLEITDSLGSLPDDGSLATDRAVVGARLALLPEGPTAESGEPKPLDEQVRRSLLTDFLDSPEAIEAGLGKLAESDELSLDFALSLVLDHAETFPDVDPLRWSPVMAQLFLLDWVHRRAVLDDNDARMLPRALRAWALFAGRRRGVPAAALERTVEAIDELTPEFVRIHASGERRSPATQAVAQLIADGVDPADTGAVTAWLQGNGNRPTSD